MWKTLLFFFINCENTTNLSLYLTIRIFHLCLNKPSPSNLITVIFSILLYMNNISIFRYYFRFTDLKKAINETQSFEIDKRIQAKNFILLVLKLNRRLFIHPYVYKVVELMIENMSLEPSVQLIFRFWKVNMNVLWTWFFTILTVQYSWAV